MFTLGLVTPLAATCLILWRAGTFARFWFWTVSYARVHTGLLPAGFVLHRLAEVSSDGYERWLFLMGFAGLLWLLSERGEKKFFFSALVIFSVLALLVGRYLARHYFLVMLPVVTPFGWGGGVRLGRRCWRGRVFRGCACSGGAVSGDLRRVDPRQQAVWFTLPPDVACADIYFAAPFVECREIGRYIREHSAPQDRIAVIGSEPEIYFYAQRHSVSGYIYMYDLVEPQPYARAMQEEFIHDVEKARPEFLVEVNMGTSWMTWADADPALFKWIRSYPGPWYDLIGVAEIYPTHTEYRWGKDAAAEKSTNYNAIFTFKRR